MTSSASWAAIFPISGRLDWKLRMKREIQLGMLSLQIIAGYKSIPDCFFLCRQNMFLMIQCLSLKRITLGQHKSDNNNRMIQLIDVFCVLLRYKWASNFWWQQAADSMIRDPIKRRALNSRHPSPSTKKLELYVCWPVLPGYSQTYLNVPNVNC